MKTITAMQKAIDIETARLQAWARAVAESDLDAAAADASARLAESTAFLDLLVREKRSRAAQLANLQAAGIDPQAATALDWFRAFDDDGMAAAESFTPLRIRAILTRNPDAAIQATTAGIEAETLFLAALHREKRVRAEARRICQDGPTQTAPLAACAAARMQAAAIIDAEDAVAAMNPRQTP